MTSGERMVFASGWTTALANGADADDALIAAASCVAVLRGLAAGLGPEQTQTTADERRAMLEDMLSSGHDRGPR